MDDTPILRHSFTSKQLSAIAALSFRQFYFRFFAGAIRTEQIIEFLGALKRHMEKPLLIVRDGAAIHRSRKLNAWQEGLNGHIALARLPAYAPKLNPVEAIWASTRLAKWGHSLAIGSSPCNGDQL
ncbi:transposase [Verminephrobacter eiseniae]|uniref:transposase n=1 Tax=Verminephrobacter eiseniae TaxID=364317 RepID=UPI002237721E|nr:transposase [Verminephrobacter eiseniae]